MAKTMDMVIDWSVAVGALNWGLAEFFDFNLVTEVLGAVSLADFEKYVYLAIGAAGAYKVADLLGLI